MEIIRSHSTSEQQSLLNQWRFMRILKHGVLCEEIIIAKRLLGACCMYVLLKLKLFGTYENNILPKKLLRNIVSEQIYETNEVLAACLWFTSNLFITPAMLSYKIPWSTWDLTWEVTWDVTWEVTWDVTFVVTKRYAAWTHTHTYIILNTMSKNQCSGVTTTGRWFFCKP